MKRGRRGAALAMILLFVSVMMLAGCRKGSGKEELAYEDEENMSFDQLLELDRQNPITIDIMVADMKEPSASDSPVLQKIAEATGTTVNIQGIESDQLQMLMASREYPDVLVIKRDSTFYDYLDTGDMIDLTPLLQTYAPTVYQMNSKLIDLFKDEDGRLLYLTENADLLREGEIHPEDATDPNRAQQEFPWHSCLYVQYPLVNEVYGQKITTFDEYKEALEAYRASYSPDDGYYALSMDKDSAGDILWAGLSMFGYKCNYKGGLYVTKDGENYTYGLKAQDALPWLLYLNELYREGYVFEDATVQSYEQFIRQMNKAKVFSFIGNYYGVYEANKALASNDKTSSISYIPQQMKADGVSQIYQYNSAYTGGKAFMIMKSSPYANRIARLLEYLYSDEGLVLHGWGIEGEDYTVKEDGTRDVTAEIDAKIKANSDYNIVRGIRSLYSVINFPTFTRDGQSAFVRFAPYYSTEEGTDARDEVIKQDPVYNWHEDWKGTFWEDYSEVDIIMMAETDAAVASAKCASVIKDEINRIIMAESAEQCEKLYNEAVDKVNAYGIEAWEKEVNDQIHAKR
jgi:putative aldouronate transport system substrate-binding protein